jgi:hypothetical protein
MYVYTANITMFHNVGTMIIVKVSNVKRKHLILIMAIAETKDKVHSLLRLYESKSNYENLPNYQYMALSPGRSCSRGKCCDETTVYVSESILLQLKFGDIKQPSNGKYTMTTYPSVHCDIGSCRVPAKICGA